MNTSRIIARIRENRPVFIVAALSLAWLLSLEWAHPNFFSYGDGVLYYLPMYVHNWSSVVQSSTIPFVNFHQYLGQTHLALGQPGVLYPPIYLAVGFSLLFFRDLYHALDFLAVLHWLAASIAMFFLLRELKIPSIISGLGALMWTTYPYLMTMATVWPTQSFLLAYLPINFLITSKLIRQPTTRLALWLAATKTWFFLGGYVQDTFMVLIFEGLLIAIILSILVRRGQSKRAVAIILPYLLALALFLALAAPILLPMYEQKIHSALRAQLRPLNEFMRYALSFKNFADAQRLTFYPQSLFWASSHVYHVGIFSLAIIPLLLFKKIRRKAQDHNVLTFAVLALAAFLLSTPLQSYLYEIPVFNWFRGPHKYFPVATFFFTITVAGTATTVSATARRQGKHAIHTLLVLSILLNMLIMWSQRDINAYSHKIGTPKTTVASQYIKPKEGRIFTFNADHSHTRAHTHLAFNFATLFDADHFAGYEPLVAKQNHDLALGLTYSGIYHSLPDQKTLDYLSEWSVRYLLTDNNQAKKASLAQFNQLTLLHENKDQLVYENTKAKPYVYEESKPDERIPFTRGINEIIISPVATQPHQLIISLAPLPRYNIYADGRSLGPVDVAHAPMIIDVPARTEQITIRYEDSLFKFGVAVSALTGIGIAVRLAHDTRRKSKKRNQTRDLSKRSRRRTSSRNINQTT